MNEQRTAYMDLNNSILCADCAEDLDENYVSEVTVSVDTRMLECEECGARI